MRDFREHHRRMHMHAECYKPNNKKKLVFGLLVIALGAFLLADNLGFLPSEVGSIIFSWPMLLIAIGIINLAGRNSIVTGGILIMVGLFFLIPRIHPFNFEFARLFWPMLFIGLGIIILLKRRSIPCKPVENEPQQPNNKDTVGDDYIDDIAILGGSKRNILSQNFKGGRITAIFGGSELDLSQSKLAEGKNTLEITAIFGGVSMVIPSDWNVRVEVVSILGGFADKRRINPEAYNLNRDKELVIKGVAIFGGGEIKSY